CAPHLHLFRLIRRRISSSVSQSSPDSPHPVVREWTDRWKTLKGNEEHYSFVWRHAD
ncbi:hypothetical protein M514_27793, partial [Trichuris suis]